MLLRLRCDCVRNDSPFDLGPTAIYVGLDDPDAHHDRAVAAGAEIVMGLTDQEYGSHDDAARDAEWNVWCFGTYRPGRPEAQRPSSTSRTKAAWAAGPPSAGVSRRSGCSGAS